MLGLRGFCGLFRGLARQTIGSCYPFCSCLSAVIHCHMLAPSSLPLLCAVMLVAGHAALTTGHVGGEPDLRVHPGPVRPHPRAVLQVESIGQS
jgi:hypothetical protein